MHGTYGLDTVYATTYKGAQTTGDRRDSDLVERPAATGKLKYGTREIYNSHTLGLYWSVHLNQGSDGGCQGLLGVYAERSNGNSNGCPAPATYVSQQRSTSVQEVLAGRHYMLRIKLIDALHAGLLGNRAGTQ